MKASTIALTAATTAGFALAQPHQQQHQHRHLHDLEKRMQTETTWVAGPTAYAFVLDGKPITKDEVCSGIASHELKWGPNAPAGICSAPSSTSAAPSTSAPSAAAFYQSPTSSSAPARSTASSTPSSSSNSSSSSEWTSWSSVQGLDTEFRDGELDCSTFPTGYGAIPLPYLGYGGWSGIQQVTWGNNAITDIVTGVYGATCQEGDMCSYACPPGYQKSQWPLTQGASGQSVGGLLCQGGKLHLTNPDLSKTLCIQGMGGVQAKNSAGGVVAICRTDYPGTESETIPVELQPGETEPLTNPNAATYYTWQGGATSAQYYLNPIGVDVQDGCQWSTPGSNKGNYAPINFGVGYRDGKTWLSIFQNKPTTTTLYEGTVELQGDLSDKCIYQNGQYCGATGCNADGCTVAVNSGTATFVISN